MDSQAIKRPARAPATPKAPLKRLPATIPYTLLHHTAIPKPHFDLLLNTGKPRLPTWRISAAPPRWSLRTCATRIKDHRRHYLTFQGPLTKNRGTVTRIAKGIAHLLAQSPTSLTLYFPALGRTLKLPTVDRHSLTP